MAGISLIDLLIIGITAASAFLIFKGLTYLTRRTGKKWGVELTFIQVLNEIIKYSIIAVAASMMLHEIGIDITAIILSLGVVGIAVGFAARDTLSNFIAGLFILADKGFKVGDEIEISGKQGRVTKMGFRITTLITADNNVITIPNSLFSNGIYINRTALDMRRVGLDITIPYKLELEDTLKALKDISSKVEGVSKEPNPNVLIKELSEEGVKATLNVWIDDPWKVAEYRSSISMEVKKLLVDKNA
ncbi:mechanosensitive ion channel family protein [Methanobacterium aggregans]|uniref:mechanosensitive ion channel family protein n=1 Tax=Methanobacterium aggregans TaxID=1615586 RepID=UPI001AE84768|nr:mechanosensitive ion channel family protein [Methanobacterium aggregans]MBP2046622.1 small conductance mechanosensitive channel [Methanobacterium aggregans]